MRQLQAWINKTTPDSPPLLIQIETTAFPMVIYMNEHENPGKKIAEKDWELLRFLDNFNVLTVSQLSALSRRSHQVIRRRLRVLADRGFISSLHRSYGKKRGRPEDLILLSMTGWHALYGHDVGNHKRPRDEKWVTPEFVEHELLLNWFIIHLIQIEWQRPQLSIHYTTQSFSTAQDIHSIEDIIRIELPGAKNKLEFIPDGIFSITDSVSKKTLLFFIEVDMGTETLASSARGLKDVRQKIVNYQILFRSGQYKRYERILQVRLNGFRLLFITHSHARHSALCRLVSSMQPSDFIWLTEQDMIFSSGLAAKIWSRGGKPENDFESILGKKMAF
jgi:hypothetical protein